MDVLLEVGSYAGLAAFLGLAVLTLLYFAQARDVRRLRESAEFLVEGQDGEPAQPQQVPPPIGAEEEATAAAQAPPATDAEAFRRSELARQAADRRERFEQRRTGDGFGGGRMPEVSSAVVIVIGGLILLGGIGFGATRLLGDDEGKSGGAGGSKANLACSPGQTQVAVLNGTAEAGLAAGSAKQLEQKGYEVRPVTNTESGFETSAVMFDTNGQQCAAEIGTVVSITATQAMDPEIQGISEGAPVAVILGEDRGSGASTAGDASATDSSSSGTLAD